MKVPVLWAKGGTAQLHSGGSEVRNEQQLLINNSKPFRNLLKFVFLFAVCTLLV
jgi:hypothetical protein